VKADAMTSFACFAIVGGVIVMSTQQWVIRQRRAVFALVATSLGITLFALFIDTTGALLESIGRNSTLTGRTQIWAAVLAQHINPILGTGFESFWMGSRMRSVWDMSQLGIEEAHNGYLEMYLNLGWVGLVLLGLLIVSGYRNATELFHLDPQAGRFRVAFFTCGLIFSCTEAGFRMLTPTWITFLMAIILVPGKGSNTSEYKVRFPLLLGISNRHMRILQ
jgi:O-antigen ligase